MKKLAKKVPTNMRFFVFIMLVGVILTGCNRSNQSELTEATLQYAMTQMQATLDYVMAETSIPIVINTALPTETLSATITPTEALTQTTTPTETSTPATSSDSTTYYYEAATSTATPSVGIILSSTSVSRGESFTVSLYGFTADADIDLWLYEYGSDTKTIYDAVTDSTGAYSTTLTMPTTATEGEYWIVYAYTTGLSTVESATSATITVAEDSTDAVVYVSSTSVTGGQTFTVTAAGFPANVDIDFRLYNEDGTSVVIKDGYTDSTGADSVSITMPISAADNEEWIVKVYTTEVSPQKAAYSITITSEAAAATSTPTQTQTPTQTPTLTFTPVPPTEEPSDGDDEG